MKKNIGKIATMGLLVGTLTLGSTGILAMANGNTYQNYKSALVKTTKAENLTLSYDAVMTVDGVTFIAGEGMTQVDGKNKYSNNTMQLNGETVELERSEDANQEIIRHGDNYISQPAYDEERNFNESASSMKLFDMVSDLLIGDVKNQFTGNGDGVSLNLEGAQIPELLNVSVTAMFEQMANHKNDNRYQDEARKDILENMPLSTDVKIESINMKASLNDGYLADQTMKVVISGLDAESVKHTIELEFTVNVSDIGDTAVKTIDLTGKEVTELTDEAEEYSH